MAFIAGMFLAFWSIRLVAWFLDYVSRKVAKK